MATKKLVYYCVCKVVCFYEVKYSRKAVVYMIYNRKLNDGREIDKALFERMVNKAKEQDKKHYEKILKAKRKEIEKKKQERIKAREEAKKLPKESCNVYKTISEKTRGKYKMAKSEYAWDYLPTL